jgi:acetyl esterase/lipase
VGVLKPRCTTRSDRTPHSATDLTLSGATYVTHAHADPFFTRPQVAEFIHSYLGSADAKHPLASPLLSQLAGMPPVRIHVGDDEVLLDDSLRYAERAVTANIDARLDVWMGMPHGFPASIGKLKAAGTSAGCRRCFPYRDAAGARESVKPVVEITAKVAGNPTSRAN